jgi:hypothetical protein
LDNVQILKELRAQRARIDNAIVALEALDPAGAAAEERISLTKPAVKSGKRVISAEARAKMAEAQQRRWAKKKKEAKKAAKAAATAAPAAPAKPVAVKTKAKKAAPKKVVAKKVAAKKAAPAPPVPAAAATV